MLYAETPGRYLEVGHRRRVRGISVDRERYLLEAPAQAGICGRGTSTQGVVMCS